MILYVSFLDDVPKLAWFWSSLMIDLMPFVGLSIIKLTLKMSDKFRLNRINGNLFQKLK